jgi:hypothetical protein
MFTYSRHIQEKFMQVIKTAQGDTITLAPTGALNTTACEFDAVADIAPGITKSLKPAFKKIIYRASAGLRVPVFAPKNLKAVTNIAFRQYARMPRKGQGTR